MEQIVIKLTRRVKRHFRRTISKTKDARLKRRYLIILHSAEGHSRHLTREFVYGPPVDQSIEIKKQIHL